jgi:hypothetical protein
VLHLLRCNVMAQDPGGGREAKQQHEQGNKVRNTVRNKTTHGQPS